MIEEPEYEEPTGERLANRIAWEKRRARREEYREQSHMPLTPIVFPDCPGLCHAARVVAGRMVDAEPDLYDALVATSELLQMLGIIDIMENGGDGRKLRVQRGPVRLPGDEEILDGKPYSDEDQEPPKTRKRRA